MRKLISALVGLTLSVLLISCNSGNPIKIDSNIHDMLPYLDYNNCHILKLCNYYTYKTNIEETVQSEVDEIVRQQLNKYPIKIKSDKAIIEQGDLAIISYSIIDGSKVLTDVKEQVVLAGNVNFDTIIEEAVVGKKIGETFTIKYTNSNYELVNAQCQITPQYIYTLSDAELNDSFVQAHFDYHSVEEWKRSIREALQNSKRQKAWSEVLNAIIKSSSFDLDEECLLDHATILAYQSEVQASLENMTLEEYVIQTMGISKEQFFEACYKSSQRDVQEYLIIGAIASKEQFEITEVEFQEYCANNGITKDDLSKEDRLYVTYHVLRNEVINLLCD